MRSRLPWATSRRLKGVAVAEARNLLVLLKSSIGNSRKNRLDSELPGRELYRRHRRIANGGGYHAFISAVVFPPDSVLALGAAGAGALSNRLASAAAVPHSRDCRGWRAVSGVVHRDAAIFGCAAFE